MVEIRKVALITGAAGGIGREVAFGLAIRGYDLALVDLNTVELEKVKLSITDTKVEVMAEAFDITDKQEVLAFIDDVRKSFGRIDVLINLAGICEFISCRDLEPEQWIRMLNINLISVYTFCKAVSELMISQGSGRIINVSSSAGEDGGVLVGAHYAASKAGVINLTKSMARLLAPNNIKVNAVSPGPTETEMICGWSPEMREKILSQIPLGRIGRPDEVAGVIFFLTDSASDYITGQVIRVNGGLIM
jgi:3-oxoacyl-[acyl-carrier protein] reductase